MADDITVRQARPADAEGVAAFTRETWDEFDRGDYVPEVFPEWVESDGPDQRTLVATAGDTVVGCCQVVRLSDHEVWTQGMRVHPDYRGEGVSAGMDDACREWARERGATVARNMVFSWNQAGLGAVRAVGYDPATEFRWAHPTPDESATAPAGDDFEVAAEPAAAWSCWQRSDACAALGGLALDPDESWALSEWTAERMRDAAANTAVFAVRDRDGTRAAAWRTRDYERESEDGVEHWAEYGASAWDDVAAARVLFAAAQRDAAAVGADRVRVLVPETPRYVSDVAAAGVDVGDTPDFVFAADLTGWG